MKKIGKDGAAEGRPERVNSNELPKRLTHVGWLHPDIRGMLQHMCARRDVFRAAKALEELLQLTRYQAEYLIRFALDWGYLVQEPNGIVRGVKA